MTFAARKALRTERHRRAALLGTIRRARLWNADRPPTVILERLAEQARQIREWEAGQRTPKEDRTFDRRRPRSN